MIKDQLHTDDGIPDGAAGVVTVSHTEANSKGGPLLEAVSKALDELDIQGILVREVGSTGLFSADPMVRIASPDLSQIVYGDVHPDTVVDVLSKHLVFGEPDREQAIYQIPGTRTPVPNLPTMSDMEFFSRQSRVVSHRCGYIVPARIDDVLRSGGYLSQDAALGHTRDEVMGALESSGLHGHGGKGSTIMEQWGLAAEQTTETCLICNALEVDEASVKDRYLLEGDPHALIEGMAIAAYALGARIGIIVVNPSYRLARARLESAIAEARRHRRLGSNIRGGAFEFDLTVRSGPVGYAAGEESALVSFLEGKAGPRTLSPEAVAAGLNGYPTIVGNVETFVRVTTIPFDADQEDPLPTRLFTLEGTAVAGVVEVEVGTTLRDLVCGIGGTDARDIKAICIGGRMGGILSPDLLDTPLTQQSYKWLSIWPGTGLVTVLDQSTSILSWLQDHLRFAASESCGYCTPCREGLAQARMIGDKLGTSEGQTGDLAVLDQLSQYVRTSSMCSYGHAVPSGVTTALQHFGNEIREQVTAQQ
ncbi:MAG: hypothetical protein HOH43_24270 [Candidatus Latescibacteria bacterium]|nr:hypothetical protein [Candidatus Latescibacterota bacterium]